MVKAIREAKVHTSWTNPDPDYEEAVGPLRGAHPRPAGERGRSSRRRGQFKRAPRAAGPAQLAGAAGAEARLAPGCRTSTRAASCGTCRWWTRTTAGRWTSSSATRCSPSCSASTTRRRSSVARDVLGDTRPTGACKLLLTHRWCSGCARRRPRALPRGGLRAAGAGRASRAARGPGLRPAARGRGGGGRRAAAGHPRAGARRARPGLRVHPHAAADRPRRRGASGTSSPECGCSRSREGLAPGAAARPTSRWRCWRASGMTVPTARLAREAAAAGRDLGRGGGQLRRLLRVGGADRGLPLRRPRAQPRDARASPCRRRRATSGTATSRGWGRGRSTACACTGRTSRAGAALQPRQAAGGPVRPGHLRPGGLRRPGLRLPGGEPARTRPHPSTIATAPPGMPRGSWCDGRLRLGGRSTSPRITWPRLDPLRGCT